ncbi:NAD(P)-binding Rossmann-fold superfamily protein [Striga asiatica]|uniref:NAD(P)-binding Rossmann-fold superfamily protein n=1 Tax=Striga asiatica TaxID=4170 RepID=A0A5A7PR99_STRAF|nr:NAD(P)-binding Rossmann-fold superfamily protein [Striga asiatica]
MDPRILLCQRAEEIVCVIFISTPPIRHQGPQSQHIEECSPLSKMMPWMLANWGLADGGGAIDDEPHGAEEDKFQRDTRGYLVAGSDVGAASRAFDVPIRARLDVGASSCVPESSGEARVHLTGVSDAVWDEVRVAGGVGSLAGDSVEVVKGCFDWIRGCLGLIGVTFGCDSSCIG